jgi:NAD(P)-dependent dehydrogenase (short-subunit alcohol dehydrogenase family)
MENAVEWTKTVAITGAGSGLGAAMAEVFAGQGWRVAVTDIDGARARETLQHIEVRGGTGFALAQDATSEEDWAALESQVQARWGGLEVLINNAGVATAGTVVDTPPEDWDWVLGIDLLGVVRGCRRFGALMQRQGGGHLVNISSFAGLAGAPGVSSYGVAKAGVVALSEALRIELGNAGVGVSVVCPAFVETRLTETMRATEPGTQDRVRRWMSRSGVTAEDVARATFEAVHANRFWVLTHKETRWLWRLKRWAPETYYRLMSRRLAE